VRGRLAADLRERLPLADDDRELGDALDRWELSLFADEPFRSAQAREALTALLGNGDGSWAASVRAALLLGDRPRDRVQLLAGLREERLARDARDAVRRSLVETLLHGNRLALIGALDETLLGVRPRPVTYLAAATAA
jgi:hypothetical protein